MNRRVGRQRTADSNVGYTVKPPASVITYLLAIELRADSALQQLADLSVVQYYRPSLNSEEDVIIIRVIHYYEQNQGHVRDATQLAGNRQKHAPQHGLQAEAHRM